MSIFACMALAAITACGPSEDTASDDLTWSSKSSSVLGQPADVDSADVQEMLQVSVNPTELRQSAIELLLQASDSTNPLLRAHAIEAMQAAPKHLDAIVRKGLADENRGVRFGAVMTVGKLKMTEISHLVEPLVHDPSESVQAASIYALHRCGKQIDPGPLADMLKSDDPEVRGNAAFVLGELGDPTAIPLLRAAPGNHSLRVAPARAKIVDMQIAEAIVKLGDDRELEVIRAALFAPVEQSEVIALACQMLGELKDAGAAPDLRNLLYRTERHERPAGVRLVAVWALAQIDSSKAPIEVPLKYVSNDLADLRAQSATALGAIGRRDSLGVLSAMLSDSNPIVQVAAAGAILKIG